MAASAGLAAGQHTLVASGVDTLGNERVTVEELIAGWGERTSAAVAGRHVLERERVAALADEVTNLVLEFGGALSGEHGDGYVRSPFMERMEERWRRRRERGF